MAIEYKLAYTASEINNRLSAIDKLATKTEIPTKVSQLENDSNYALRSELPKLFEVTVTDNGDGTYTSSHYFSEIKTAYDSGKLPIVALGARRYTLTSRPNISILGAVFGMFDGAIHTEIAIKASDVVVTKTTLVTSDEVNSNPFYLVTADTYNDDGTISVVGYYDGDNYVETTSVRQCVKAYLQGRVVELKIGTEDFVGQALPCISAGYDWALFGFCLGDVSLYAEVADGVVSVSQWECPTKVSQLENDKGYLTEHQDISGKLDASKLQEAVNAALAQAKESGEFDGATGQRGTGLLAVTTAPSSYTTAVGGITPKYRMAISTIKTQAGVTEVLLGDTVRYSYYHYPIDYLDASYAYFTERVSIRGATGADGTTPVKGTDYYTEADKADIIRQVLASMATPVAGIVDENNNIIITGELPDGAYKLRYEYADGTAAEIGTLNISSGPAYTNLADPSNADWLTNKRINSSKNIVDVTEVQRGDKTVVVTNFISIAGVSKLHIKGLDIVSDLVNGSSTQNYGRVYDYAGATILGSSYSPESGINSKTHYTYADYDSSVLVFDIATMLKDWGGTHTSATHVRLGGILTGAEEDVIITADENIE